METTYLTVEESVGDIFDTEPNAILVHSCNCRGSWSAGIARIFQEKYPEAFEEYRSECRSSGTKLLGKCLIVECSRNAGKYFVGCLFVSSSYGKYKDSKENIMANTRMAIEDLLFKIAVHNATHEYENIIKEIKMCKINSGLFNVPWKNTKTMLENIIVKDYDIKSVSIIDLKNS